MSEKPNRTIKQRIYAGGSSRIFMQHENGENEMLAQTYQSKEFAEEIMRVTKKWFAPGEESTAQKIKYACTMMKCFKPESCAQWRMGHKCANTGGDCLSRFPNTTPDARAEGER